MWTLPQEERFSIANLTIWHLTPLTCHWELDAFFVGCFFWYFFWMLQKTPICNYVFICKVQSLISKYLLNHTVSKICRLSIISEDVQFISFIFGDFTSGREQKSRWRSLKILLPYIDPTFVISIAYLLNRKDMTRHISL